jgi:hypothetical protein
MYALFDRTQYMLLLIPFALENRTSSLIMMDPDVSPGRGPCQRLTCFAQSGDISKSYKALTLTFWLILAYNISSLAAFHMQTWKINDLLGFGQRAP